MDSIEFIGMVWNGLAIACDTHVQREKDREGKGDKVLITCKVCIALTESNNKNSRATQQQQSNSDCAYIEKRISYTEIKTFNLFIKLHIFFTHSLSLFPISSQSFSKQRFFNRCANNCITTLIHLCIMCEHNVVVFSSSSLFFLVCGNSGNPIFLSSTICIQIVFF